MEPFPPSRQRQNASGEGTESSGHVTEVAESFFFGLTFASLQRDPRNGRKRVDLSYPVGEFRRTVEESEIRTEDMNVNISHLRK